MLSNCNSTTIEYQMNAEWIEYSFQETNGMLGLQKMETSMFDDS